VGGQDADLVVEAGIDERKPVLRRCAVAAAGKAELLERVVEEAACEVAGEGPAGAVRAPEAGGQADDEEPRALRTKRGDGRVEPLRLATAPFLAECLEARTQRAVAAGLAGRGGHC